MVESIEISGSGFDVPAEVERAGRSGNCEVNVLVGQKAVTGDLTSRDHFDLWFLPSFLAERELELKFERVGICGFLEFGITRVINLWFSSVLTDGTV